jgi:hypothetical protein
VVRPVVRACDCCSASFLLRRQHFGGSFQTLRTTNTVVVIDEYLIKGQEEAGVRYLKWSFGKSLEKSELRFGYVMKVSQSLVAIAALPDCASCCSFLAM